MFLKPKSKMHESSKTADCSAQEEEFKRLDLVDCSAHVTAC